MTRQYIFRYRYCDDDDDDDDDDNGGGHPHVCSCNDCMNIPN